MSAFITGTWQYYRLAFPPCFLHSILVCVLPWSPLSPSEFSEWKVETGRQEISAFFPKVLKNVSWDEDPGQWLLLETDSLHGMVHWLAVCNSALEWITHTLVTRRHHWCDCTRLLCCMWLLNLIVSYLKAYNGYIMAKLKNTNSRHHYNFFSLKEHNNLQ